MSLFPQTLKVILLPAVFVLPFLSCERKGIHDIIPERTMVDVVYDYQLAVALAETEEDSRKMAEKEYLYTQAVFKKYGITPQQYELSVAHYARNPKTMLKITDEVSERYVEEIKEESEKMREDGTVPKGIRYDTVMIWQVKHDVLLSASGDNCYDAEIPCKSLKRGARLMVGFNTSWVYREGAKQGYYQISVTYSNDSTYTQGEEIREFGAKQGTSVYLSDHYDVRRVSLRIYQDARWKPFPQLLCLNDVRAWSITAQTVEKTKHGSKRNSPENSGSAPASERRAGISKPDSLP